MFLGSRAECTQSCIPITNQTTFIIPSKETWYLCSASRGFRVQLFYIIEILLLPFSFEQPIQVETWLIWFTFQQLQLYVLVLP